jgi:hemolysin activation/secretion protein
MKRCFFRIDSRRLAMNALLRMLLIPVFLYMAVPVFAQEQVIVPRFAVNQYVVTGDTILGAARIAALVKPFTGPDRDFGDVQQALEALEAAYRSKGYNSVTVILPEQELRGGDVLIKVIESKIVSIAVEGNRHFSTANIEAGFPTLQKGKSPLVHKVSQNLRVVNENPAKKATLQLQNGANEDELNAVLKITDEKPWRLGLTFDNTGNKATGDYRIGFLGQYFNLFNRDHVGTIQFATSPDKTNKVASYSASYRIPIYRFGDSMDFFGGYSDVDSGTMQINLGDATASFLSNIASSGKGLVSGIRYNYNLRRLGAYEHKLVGGVDYRRYDQKLAMEFGGITSPGDTTVTAHPLSLSYSGALGFERGDAGFYLGVIRNDRWGGGEQSDFDKQPGQPPVNYTILRFGASAGYAFFGDWQFRLLFNGQYTGDTLISGEQFGFGGSAGGRGYKEREVSGDQGYAGTAEIYTPDLARFLSIPGAGLRLLGFYDDGVTFKNHPARGENDRKEPASAGAGLRLTYSKYFIFALDWGYALHSLSGESATQSGDGRIHFRAMLTF